MHPTPSSPNQPAWSGQMVVALAVIALGLGAWALLLYLLGEPGA